SGVENLIPIPSESEGIPEHVYDVPFHDNSLPLDISKDQIEDFSESNEEFSSTDDDSFSLDDIDYVEASPPNSELVSSEVMEIVIPEVGGIEASNDNPIPFYDPIISGTPPNLTRAGESDFFLEFKLSLKKGELASVSECTGEASVGVMGFGGKVGYELLGFSVVAVPVGDDFKTFSNSLFHAGDNFSSSDDESFSDEDVLKEIYSNPLFDEEIISIKIDPHHFNAKSDLIESLLNQDSSIISSPKIDSLLEEFFGELTHIDLIPSRINEADFEPEEEICLVEKLLIVTLLWRRSILTPDDSMPPGIENDDYDSERDIIFLEELLMNDSHSLPENESFHFDVPSSICPPAKPPDDDEIEPDTGLLTTKVVGDISKHYILMPRLLSTQPTLCPVIDTLLLFLSKNEDKVHLLSHRGFKVFQLIFESPMMIYRGNVPTLVVPFLHFYPP
nr:hypothetical protein [Tanacetum cinerariifolium]